MLLLSHVLVTVRSQRLADWRHLQLFWNLEWIHVILRAFPHQIHGKSDIVLPYALLIQ